MLDQSDVLVLLRLTVDPGRWVRDQRDRDPSGDGDVQEQVTDFIHNLINAHLLVFGRDRGLRLESVSLLDVDVNADADADAGEGEGDTAVGPSHAGRSST